MNMRIRPRRLRYGETLRKMVRETRVDPSSLIYPMFVKEGTGIVEEIPTMPGQYRYSIDTMERKLEELLDAGVSSVMFFGIPDHKDEVGSGAYAEDGIVQRAVRLARREFPEMYLITDVCMCEYTSHGHCGVLCGHDVDNDATLKLLAKSALSHVQAVADMVAPSDMMDGRVAAIRDILDENGYKNTPIMSYAVKYASAFSVMQQDQLLHSVTARATRWITTTAGKELKKHFWMYRRVRILLWSSLPCPISIW